MAKLLKLRRGTTSQHSSFTGAEGECTVDTDKETLVVHNGSTAGGFALARADNPDNQKVRFGTGNDLEIYHDGSENWIKGATSGQALNVRSQGNIVFTVADTENAAKLLANGAVELYYDNVKKLQTTADGIEVTGKIFSSSHIDLADSVKLLIGTGDDLEIYHSGSNSILKQTGTGNLLLITGGSENMAKFIPDGAVELYHDNSKKFETTSAGATVTGNIISTNVEPTGNINLPDSSSGSVGRIRVGNGEDFQLYHDGTNTQIRNTTGLLTIGTDTFNVYALSPNETMLKAESNGNVELYFNGSKKLETTSTGITVSGTVKPSGGNLALMDSSAGGNGRATFGGADDLQIYHDGNNSYVTHSGGGDLLIDTEGTGEDIYIRSQDNLYLRTNNNVQDSIVCVGNGQVELYNANVKQVQTGADGLYWADSKKAHFGNNSDLTIYHDGSSNIFKAQNGPTFFFADSENAIKYSPNGSVELYYDNSKKLETKSYGVFIDGHIQMDDSDIIKLGNGNDLQIYHNGSNSFIGSPSHALYIDSNLVTLRNGAGSETMAQFQANAEAALYYNNVKQLETTSAGVKIFASSTNPFEVKATDIDATGPWLKVWNSDSVYGGGVQVKNNNALGGVEFLNASGNNVAGLYNSTGGWHWQSNLILDGSGIRFNGDTATANELDDYEEGTFSANYSASGYTSTAATNEYYIKIGRLVWFSLTISPAANAADGDLTITGLPFATSEVTARANGHWQDGASFNITGGRISGTQIERCNAVAFPNHSSGNATWVWSGTYQTA